jgi:hypothetical protein
VARNHLSKLLQNDGNFPAIRKILQFEGKNGPDAIKRKSPAKDEPWHYFDPFDDSDVQLIEQIEDHYGKLVAELKAGNKERSAFEAAWLAHAIVDGLTPAHHYPYEEKLAELMGGEGLEARTTIWTKNIMPGDTSRERLKNNWQMWGPRGLLLSHGMFEFGIATLIAPLRIKVATPTKLDIKRVERLGVPTYFRQIAQEVAGLNMYHKYHRWGWTPKLARQVRKHLSPALVRTVTLIWYAAAKEAGRA